MRRFFSVFAAAALAITLTACAGADKTVTDDRSKPEYGDKETTAMQTPEETAANPVFGDETQEPTVQEGEGDILTAGELERLYPQKTVLVWVNNDMCRITRSVNLAINDILAEQGCEYVVLFESIEEERFEKYLNFSISNKNAPDLISAGVGEHGTYQGTYRAYKNGWLMKLNDYFETEDGRKLWDSVPKECWLASGIGNEYQGICTMLPTMTDYVYYVNKDIMKKYGFTEEDIEGKQVAELGSLLDAVKDTDCTKLELTAKGRGEKVIAGIDTVVENRGYQSDAIIIDVLADSEKAQNFYSDERVAAYFRAIREYADKGYLDSRNADGEKYGNFFISVGYDNRFVSSYSGEVAASLRKEYPNAGEIAVIPCAARSITTYFNSISGVCASSQHQKEALDMLTRTMTDRRISDLLLYGIEGEHYTLDKDGKAVTDGYSWLYSMYFGNTFISTPMSVEPSDKEKVFAGILAEMKKNAQLGRYVDLTDFKDKVAEIRKITEEYGGLWTGKYEDTDAVLYEINKRMEDAGIQEVIDAVNEQLQ